MSPAFPDAAIAHAESLEFAALNRPEPLKRPPTTTAVIWLIGMLTLLTGVVLRIAGNKPLGGAILLLGAVILILGRLGNLRGR